jgi:hypothetical protein
LLALAFLPYILINIFTGVKMFTIVFPAIRNLLNSGQPDFQRLPQIIAQMPRPGILLMKLPELVLLLNLPLAVGALMYAYEDLFGTRTAPGS